MQEIITIFNTSLSRQALRKQVKGGKLIRLFRGAYVEASSYEGLDLAGKYRVRAKAFLAIHPKVKAWGVTAAALDGGPVLSTASLHFSARPEYMKSKADGCHFHLELPPTPVINNHVAQMLFECALTSPLPDTLMAAHFILHRHSTAARKSMVASREIDGKTTEALVWQPLYGEDHKVSAPSEPSLRKLNAKNIDFLDTYTAARKTPFSSPAAELFWFDYAQLCVAHNAKRAISKAVRAGLYFTDLPESPAESLFVARCVELGFAVPYLQANIIDPASGQLLGRVDGLWPSNAVRRNMYQSDSKYGRYFFSKQHGDQESIIVEFDGQLKYTDDYVAALDRERKRQNAISNLGYRFVRISWEDLMQVKRLHSILTQARVPLADGRRYQ